MGFRVLTDEERAQHERIHGRFGDARAQLWARVYADEVKRLRDQDEDAHAREWACQAALAAVEDFDAHYTGGKR
jgi:hypothetical protein